MTVATPAFLGVILRKNARTERFIARETERLLKYFPRMSRGDLNEDSQIIGFSVAMNGADLKDTVNDLEKDGAVLGKDFVPTSSPAGALGALPNWLVEAPASDVSPPEGAEQQAQKCYRVAVGHESDA